MAERSKAWVYSRLSAGVAGSNPAGSMDVCVVCVLYSKDKRYNQDKEVVKMKYREQKKIFAGEHGCLSLLDVAGCQ